jgi:chemotaxis protein CheZ
MPAARKVAKRKTRSGAKSGAKSGGRKKKPSKPGPSQDIANSVEKLITAVGNDITPTEQALYSEVVALARYIQTARDEIAAIRPDVVKTEHLPAAADELDAIIDSTAEATNTIMDAAEIIEGVADLAEPEAAGKLVDATTRIYEACGFQDITGQRVSKVVATLKHIEKTIDDLVAAIEGDGRQHKPSEKPKGKKTNRKKSKASDKDLLNGPQLGGPANSQAEIDALMDTFD